MVYRLTKRMMKKNSLNVYRKISVGASKTMSFLGLGSENQTMKGYTV